MAATDENTNSSFIPTMVRIGEPAQDDLREICKQGELIYTQILQQNSRESVIAVSQEFKLAQLYLALGDLTKAKPYFLHAMPVLEANDSFTQETVDAAQIPYSHFLYMDHNAEEAIARLEKQLALWKNNPTSDRETYWCAIDLLASIYSLEQEYQKSTDLQCEQLSILMKKHTEKNGSELTKDNIDFEKPVLDKIISLYLGIGANFSRLGQHWEAKQYFEKGYFISYTAYGDRDERTLKLNYNLAVNEFGGFDSAEGLRQLKYVYADLQKYLGSDNMYTQKAKSVLEQLNEHAESDVSDNT